MNLFKIPLLMPFKFVKETPTPGMHFDDSWACDQIRKFERRALYHMKWNRADTTPLQIESSIPPNDLQLRTKYGAVVKSFAWTKKVDGITYSIWETLFDVNSVATDDVYFLTQKATSGSINWATLSEPISIKDNHEDTHLIRYYNSYNKDDVAFTTGLQLKFRCEWDIQDFEPDMDDTGFVDQLNNPFILERNAKRLHQFYIGTAPGVAPYIIDMLNRIFSCDHVYLEEEQYTALGEKLKINRVRGYPLVGGAIQIVPSKNPTSIEFADTTPLSNGLVTAYNIETGFFGPGALVPVTEVEING